MIERIVQINDLSDPRGGASKLAVQAACGLAVRGHRVTFVTGDAGKSATLVEAGVKIVALGGQRLLAASRGAAIVTGLWNRAAHALMRDWIARNDTPGTVYHLHGWSQILSPAIFSALEPVRDRLIISAHDFFLACPNGAFALLRSGEICPHLPLSRACLTTACDRDGTAHKLWRSARHIVQRQAYRPRSSPPVLAIHANMGRFLVRAGIPSDAIIPLPNPVEPFSSSRIHAERNGDVLFVGRLEETKGADLAARAAALAGAPLTVVGEGPLTERIREIHPAARLVGRRTPAEISEFAARARALVMPSRYPEPFGLVAMEAAWSGLPVILANTALLANDLVACGAAIAVEPRDTPVFADAIRHVLADGPATKRMSEAGFVRTRGLAMTPPAWIDSLEDIFDERLSATTKTRHVPRSRSSQFSI